MLPLIVPSCLKNRNNYGTFNLQIMEKLDTKLELQIARNRWKIAFIEIQLIFIE